MKKWLGVGLVLLATSVNASDAAVEAEKLLEVSGTKAAMEQMTEMMIDQQLKQNPNLQPFKATIMKFYNKHLSYESLKDDYIQLYTSEFSGDELAQLNEFYQTPVGQKAVQKLPLLMRRGGEIGARRVQQNIGELQQMLKTEAERLKAEQESKTK